MRPRGSKIVQHAREDAYARGLSENGDHVCVPWLGVDMDNRYVCPGFEYKPNRGLIAYVIPLVLYREAGLVPGFGETKIATPSNSTQAALARAPVKADPLPLDTLESEYFHLLKKYLRVIKIAGMETEIKFMPYPDDYYVVVHGPYERALIGHLVTRPDRSGSRFLVPDGIHPADAEASVQASRINATASAPAQTTGAPPTAPRVPAPSPKPPLNKPMTGGAAFSGAAIQLKAGNRVNSSFAGVPKAGDLLQLPECQSKG